MWRLLGRKLFVKNQNVLNLFRFSSTRQNQLLNSVVVDDEFLSIQWKDGNFDEFPHIYLRENCSKYQNPITKGRIISPLDLDMNVVPKHVYIDSNVLNVIWNDGHTSLYTTEELQLLRHKPQTQETEILADHVKLWGDLTSFKNKTMPVFDYQRLMENDYTLYQWLVELAFKTGIAKIENIPVEKLQLQKLGNRVGYLVSTNYGLNFEVKTHSQDNVTDIGYTSAELQLHTDFNYTYHPPMIGMFHCLQHSSKGGANRWSDGFYAAYRLFKEDPESFYLLAETPVAFCTKGRSEICDYNFTSRQRLISLDFLGKLSQVCYRNDYRDRNMPLEPKHMKAFYKAYGRFTELLNDDESSFWLKIMSGEAMTFNNFRVLHARSAFEIEKDSKSRWLQFAYMNLDCVHSKIRLLAEKHGVSSPV
ncbi:gamma-butyrobetaine dioxygenase-like [Xenia sp. Carnegie-2017]|uniref:gamma-butyrobetaine dioxygenase-like n=1 Tax=Xenia sp. Carnegie-2017 TaxID=2897299 RepID=UPI001F04F0CE|nr:gamma-butyrobetaine dioxygenase-like [Xenia sp. Carnegie-2017]